MEIDELFLRATRLVKLTRKALKRQQKKKGKMKILRFELDEVIECGSQEITLPGGAKPFHSQWEGTCPAVYFGDAFGGELITINIKAISEKENRNAPYVRGDLEVYVGVALEPKAKELFFLFAVLKGVDELIQAEGRGEGELRLVPDPIKTSEAIVLKEGIEMKPISPP
jgi:hypothetical protein